MKDCVFCKIIAGQLPSYKIYEDDFVMAFLDISNDAYGHTLIVPKKHYDTMMTCDNTTLCRVIEAVKKVGNHYVKDCGFDGWNLVNNTGKAAGPHLMHFHIHLVPRKFGDNAFEFPVLSGGGEDLQKVCEALKFSEETVAKVDDENSVVLYTDGACSGNPGAGGWAAILSYKGKEKVLSGGDSQTTNNRMELLAVIMGLESIKGSQPVEVFSDSAYVVNAFLQGWIENWKNNNWKTSGNSDVQNKDLWQRLLLLIEKLDVRFHKVKGHSDNAQNNRCDALAREEISKLQN